MAKKAEVVAKKPAVKKPVARAKTTTKVKTVSAKPAKTTAKSVEPVVTRPVAARAEPRRRLLKIQLADTRVLGSLVAEFLGTFALATGALVLQGNPLYMMFVLVATYLIFSALSGGFYNPALAIAGWITKRLSGFRALAYVVAQVLGAVLAFVVVSAFVKAAPAVEQTMFAQGGAVEIFKATAIPAGKEWFILAAEMIGTAILAFAAASMRDKISDLARAWTYGAGLLLGLGVSGMAQVGLASIVGGSTILNPALAVSLQALSLSLWPIAIYVIGTVVAAVLAFALHDFLARATRA